MIEQLTDKNYREILDKNRVSVVKVYADWCGPCKLMKTHFSRWSEDFSVYNGEEIRYYEVNNDKSPEFIREFGVTHLPTTIFFVHGVVVFVMRGMTRSKVFEEMLKRTLSIKYEKREE